MTRIIIILKLILIKAEALLYLISHQKIKDKNKMEIIIRRDKQIITIVNKTN